MTVYVYVDEDHGDIEVCSTLELAKTLGWPESEEWDQDSDTLWIRGEYCFIYKREVTNQ